MTNWNSVINDCHTILFSTEGVLRIEISNAYNRENLECVAESRFEMKRNETKSPRPYFSWRFVRVELPEIYEEYPKPGQATLFLYTGQPTG